VEELESANDLVKVYPNPASSVISIRLTVGSQQLAVAEILDLYGNVVQEMVKGEVGEGVMILDIGHLPTGIYIIRIRVEDQLIVKKVIKF
jgi:hypothetical protein